MLLYKIDSIHIHNVKENTSEVINQFLQKNKGKLSAHSPYYIVYDHYESDFKGDYDVSIVLDSQIHSQQDVIEIEDLALYEVFQTNLKKLTETWQGICRKGQQGLLKRAYGIDFEKHHSNGKIEIYISITPHC